MRYRPKSIIYTKMMTYCATGANGYVGSWLVKSLLGYLPPLTAKSQYFQTKWRGNERLRLFRVDLQGDGSFDDAIKGYDGVFHIAASMEFDISPNHVNLGTTYVQGKVIDPAIKGVRNVLGSCLKSKSVKRVVFTSSISTLTSKDENERWRSIVGETCKIPIDRVLKTKASGWICTLCERQIYVLPKLISEEESFRYEKERGLDLPSSSLSPITGARLFAILSAVNKRMGSIGLVHVQDICIAHLFLMEEPKAEGQYICCVDNIYMHDLLLNHTFTKNFTRLFSVYRVDDDLEERPGLMKPMISSKKLRKLGFQYKYGIEGIIHQQLMLLSILGFLP
uniref:NAD-dependent epimerase/dehydratase domain-containing protein n=1 Tax=Brassica campestris TaxID=3711 RepID=A0A3P5ZRR6_BRACM|nr:unnamed protein product [Brassica rapa]